MQLSDETRDMILSALGTLCAEYAGYCYTLQQEQRRTWADDIPQAVARKLRGDGPDDGDNNPFDAYLTDWQAHELETMARLAGAWPVWSCGVGYVEGLSYDRWRALW
jgi:hypothetical protein